MPDTPIQYTPETGFRRAQELIAECIATQSTTLDLGNLALREVPEELGECVWVRELNLGNFFFYDEEKDEVIHGQEDKTDKNLNQFTDFPRQLSPLGQLEVLCLDETGISDLAPVAGLTSLTSLNFSKTNVSDLAPVAGLTSLTSLGFSKTNVSDLAPLRALTALSELYLFGTPVSDLTPLATLTALNSLDLSSTEVSNLAPLTTLTALSELYLLGTPVSDLAPLASLVTLSELYLSGNEVRNLVLLAGLTVLTKLDLEYTQVNDLAPLAGLTSLTSLNLFYTQVSDLTPLAGSTSLTSLNLSFTEVSDLTPLAGLSALGSLCLVGTKVSDLAPLAMLTTLTSLDLNETSISNLTPLAGLTSLTSLNFSRTNVSDLTPLAGLTSLTSLNFSSKNVSDLTPLAGLTSLTELNLSYTQVSDLASLARLTALSQLSFSKTQVNDLSPLTWLTALTSLDISSTQVSDLSPLLALTKLKRLDVRNNPQLNYPPEIFEDPKQSYPNLVAWEADMAKGSHPNQLFKLIICGNGTVGKTKIAKRIETGKYQEDGESTEGVQLYLTPEKSFAEGYPPIRLHIWDFAGQEIYYQLHRLFFRRRAVYLIVYDRKTWEDRFQSDPKTGQPDENRSLDYWLNDIRASAEDAPIILVQNKLDEDGILDINERLPEALRELPRVQVSAHSGLRFGELLTAIHQAIARLPQADLHIPQSWWAVREAILDLQRVQGEARMQLLDLEDFRVLCQEKDLCAGSETALLTYLDGCGVILYDGKLFPDKIVLDQQWALDAIYVILRRIEKVPAGDWHKIAIQHFQQNCALRNGLFTAEQLPFGSEYTAAEKDLFLKIMLRARICFKTNAEENGGPLYLLFHFLRDQQPEAVKGLWATKSGAVVAQRYVFTYYLHKGIFRELLQEIFGKVSLAHVWQEGLLLTWRDMMALVTVNYEPGRSYLEISSAGSPHLTQHLLAAFRKVLKKQLEQSSAYALHVSNNGSDWFDREKIQEANEMEAKYAPTVAGGKSDGWRELLWCLREDEKAGFDAVPEERHQEQVVPPPAAQGSMAAVRARVRAGDDLWEIMEQLEGLVPDWHADTFALLSADINDYLQSTIRNDGDANQLQIWKTKLRGRLVDFTRLLEKG